MFEILPPIHCNTLSYIALNPSEFDIIKKIKKIEIQMTSWQQQFSKLFIYTK